MIPPKLSYTIWFSQRTGSTLLNHALASTGIAGNPAEWLHGGFSGDVDAVTREDIEKMWKAGMTPNGVFGVKSLADPRWIRTFRRLYNIPDSVTQAEVWRTAFPNCNKHIYMTRRNKVRLAVSWWRAIVSGEWHRQHGQKPQEQDIADQYKYEAIEHLLVESNMMEAAIAELFREERIVPLTIVYEDFIQDYEGTVMKVLQYLELPTANVNIAPAAFDRIADHVAEEWVQRFRKERQHGWENLRW